MGRNEAELSLLLTDDRGIRELNRTWRGIDRPTDVLGFAMGEGELGRLNQAMLGDIAISLETAARQAEARGTTLEREVTALAIHGLLHLLGRDHRTPAESRAMRAEERRLLALLAIP